MSEPGPLEWSNDVTDVIATLTDRWVLAGALAAMHYRRAQRGTTDADIYVEWREDLAPTLDRAGYDVRVIRDPQADNPHMIVARRDGARIDLLIPTVPYQEQAIDRGRARHVLTIEDVLIHKLIAWRPRDKDDVASILAAGHDFDRDYVEHWAGEWEVTDRWREATRRI